MVLTNAVIFADNAVWGEPDMRCDQDEKVSVFWYVMAVCSKSDFADERYASQATHVEGSTPEVCQSSVDASIVMIDFIGANTAGHKCVISLATQ